MNQSAANQDEINENLSDIHKFRRADSLWVLNLFGTAVGAGILYLPINAGIQGFWPLLFMAILAGPMVYFSHQALARLVQSSSAEQPNIVNAVIEHFGKRMGFFITFLYFAAFFPVLLIYGVGLTNTTDSFHPTSARTS